MNVKIIRGGLTQQEFADKLGVTRQTIINWESGKTKPNGMAQKLLEEIQRVRVIINEFKELEKGG